ncbi:putative O-methyltransferase [Mesorhizobium sp. J18]|uniref:O-methyltransferase n=1 Tax=Mesorhizobium sp. J18 TaxID=935263 RepID=UPI00119C4F80|nr:class I SAM-dependent methyltransferase [Mesorhizobium sp. J18]TWG97291.1 putative O-methyltransferase [Mesorhizobium sp. J18]
MSCTLLRPDVAATLAREHAAAKAMREARRIQSCGEGRPETHKMDFRTSEAHRTQYLSIGPRMGRFLYNSVRAIGARNIVEFGTSFGVSTLYLAAAATDTGGKVTGSEYHANKAEKARSNLADAGLSARADIRVGDARETLRTVEGPIDLLFLDGAKDLYIEILKMLEDRLRPGAFVITDNADHLPRDEGFLRHVGQGSSRYLTTLIGFNKGMASQSLVLS